MHDMKETSSLTPEYDAQYVTFIKNSGMFYKTESCWVIQYQN